MNKPDPAMHQIVFLDRASLIANMRAPDFAHQWTEYDATAAVEIAPRLSGATIAITNKVPIRAPDLARLPDLRMIAVAATGTDVIDLAACRQRGIVVSNIRNYAAATVPEHVFALTLALRRNLFAYRRSVEQGAWQNVSTFALLTHRIGDLAGHRMGIVGFGVLGRAVARLALAFGMDVCVATRTPIDEPGIRHIPLDALLKTSDVVSLHLPLTGETRGMIGERELTLMKPTALLINTARGGLVEEQALVDALQSGRIGGAGFDVLSEEPPQQGNPLLALRQDNFILTPHVAWASNEAMQRLADQLIDNIEAFAAGAPRNAVA